MRTSHGYLPWLMLFAAATSGCSSSEASPTPSTDAGEVADAGVRDADAGVAPAPTPVQDAAPIVDAATERPPSPCDGHPPTTWTVTVTEGAFAPQSQAVCPGDTVQWIWKQGLNSVTSGFLCQANDAFASGWHGPPFTYEVTFTDPAGLFMYYSEADCQNMVGAILIVR